MVYCLKIGINSPGGPAGKFGVLAQEKKWLNNSPGPVMRSSVFVAFDTETTGLYPGFDQIVEIAACRFHNGTITDQFQTLVNPMRDIPDEVVAIHGITEEMVRDAPSGDIAVRDFLEYIGEDPLLAHNAPFDERFISFNCHKFEIKTPSNPVYDSLLLTRRLFPELKSHGLASLTDVFGISHTVKHRAMPDVIGLRGVFEQCINRLEKNQICTLQQFELWYGDPIHFSPDKYDLLVSLPEEYKELKEAIEKGVPMEVMYEDRSGKRTRRMINPQGLYVAYGNLYLTAFCHLRDANRNFKLERIHAFRIVEETDGSELLDQH
jgi:DNA polymerase III epsilon subunit family exonuclease